MSDVLAIARTLTEQPPADPAEVAECSEGRFDAVRQGTVFDPAIIIERADPAVLISSGLLYHIIAGDSPCAKYDPDERLIKIRAENGTWIYRIGRPVATMDAFCMRWPD